MYKSSHHLSFPCHGFYCRLCGQNATLKFLLWTNLHLSAGSPSPSAHLQGNVIYLYIISAPLPKELDVRGLGHGRCCCLPLGHPRGNEGRERRSESRQPVLTSPRDTPFRERGRCVGMHVSPSSFKSTQQKAALLTKTPAAQELVGVCLVSN